MFARALIQEFNAQLEVNESLLIYHAFLDPLRFYHRMNKRTLATNN